MKRTLILLLFACYALTSFSQAAKISFTGSFDRESAASQSQNLLARKASANTLSLPSFSDIGSLQAQADWPDHADKRKVFSRRLSLQLGAGLELSKIEERPFDMNSGQAGTTTERFSGHNIEYAIAPSLRLEYQTSPHFALISGFDFFQKEMDVFWYRSTVSNLNPSEHTFRGILNIKSTNLRWSAAAKYLFGDLVQVGILAGPYLDFKLDHVASGSYSITVSNSGGEQGPLTQESVDNIFGVAHGLKPAQTKIGFMTGADLSWNLRERHAITCRVLAGRDFSRTFSGPGAGILWINGQVGYRIRLN